MSEAISTADHYNQYYQDTVRLERGCDMGLPVDEVYQQEAAWSLKACGVDASYFQPGEGILDIASGAGNHVKHMNQLLGRTVAIDGVDGSEALIAEANKMKTEIAQSEVHNEIAFYVGDMAKISELKLDKTRYKLITILGSSFCYLNKAKTKKALHDLYNKLEPGGKIVVQYRAKDQNPTAEMIKNLEAGKAKLHMKTTTREINGKATELYTDETNKDSVYEYQVDCPLPDQENPQEYTQIQREGEDVLRYADTDGIQYKSFGRVYIDSEGVEHQLAPTMVNWFLGEDTFPVTKKVMEEAGFQDVEMKTCPKRMGTTKIIAITATT